MDKNLIRPSLESNVFIPNPNGCCGKFVEMMLVLAAYNTASNPLRTVCDSSTPVFLNLAILHVALQVFTKCVGELLQFRWVIDHFEIFLGGQAVRITIFLDVLMNMLAMMLIA